jgi:hypothetical protein
MPPTLTLTLTLTNAKEVAWHTAHTAHDPPNGVPRGVPTDDSATVLCVADGSPLVTMCCRCRARARTV